MSSEVVAAAWQVRGLTSGQRLVLLRMAEVAHPDGTNSFLSVATIADDTELDRRTVQRTIQSLLEAGLLKVQAEARQHRARMYRLLLPGLRENLPQDDEPEQRRYDAASADMDAHASNQQPPAASDASAKPLEESEPLRTAVGRQEPLDEESEPRSRSFSGGITPPLSEHRGGAGAAQGRRRGGAGAVATPPDPDPDPELDPPEQHTQPPVAPLRLVPLSLTQGEKPPVTTTKARPHPVYAALIALRSEYQASRPSIAEETNLRDWSDVVTLDDVARIRSKTDQVPDPSWAFARSELGRVVAAREHYRDPWREPTPRERGGTRRDPGDRRDEGWNAAAGAGVVVGTLEDGTLVRKGDVARGSLADGRPVPERFLEAVKP